MRKILSALAAAVGVLGAQSAAASPLLYAWATHEDAKQGGFMTVINSDPASAGYGNIVSVAPTGMEGDSAHHIEYEMPGGSTLFANDWGTGRTFIFDIKNRAAPRVSASFERAGEFIFPHSFARLPNGNVLATFQSIGEKYAPPGGLVELDNKGKLVRAARSETAAMPNAINWPYSLAVVPGADRVITTSTDMGRGKDWTSPETSHVQIWSLSGLKLLSTLALPEAAGSPFKVNVFPAEPRVLNDGSVYVNSFTCGLFRVEGITSERPSATFVHAFPGGTGPHDMCAVPLVYGKYWIQTVGAINGLVVLDVSNPAKPIEVSRISLPHKWHMPHWISADRTSGRVAVTGARDGWLAMLRFDEASGKLSVDEAFGDGGAIIFDKGKSIVHGVVFSR